MEKQPSESSGKASAPIICFGEILWDNLPTGRIAGGAPMNVAYHLHRLGRSVIPVTAVGNDKPGEELLERLRDRGLDTSHVAVVDDLPTGIVNVTLSETGSASYEIVEPVAWDRIDVTESLLQSVPGTPAIIYGTLAGRSTHNLHALLNLLDAAPHALHVLDVNLRPPYDSRDRLLQLATRSTLVKLNHEEAEELTGISCSDMKSAAMEVADHLGCRRICITAGVDGGGLLMGDEWYREQGRHIEVRDTVGAGDAFLAALVDGLLDPDSSPQDALRRACRLGEFIAASRGATPDYSLDDPSLAGLFNHT